ncbi:MAG TPA: hypothetical protein PK784_06760 [Tenuifilaceae bacterium]|nr:hypothetical protein [Tenuifilaceae bacterium]HPN22250.1 hypothetical protein [Tenuifilaceae bacterium]
MIKDIFILIENHIWNLRCRYNYWMHGAYGLTRTIEKMPFRFVVKYFRKYGATVGENVIIDSGFKIHRPSSGLPLKNLVIGDSVYIGHRVLFDLTEKITFENNTAMGADCQIWTHVGNYKENLRDKNDYKEKIAPVILRSGVVVYSCSVLNPGTDIGEKSRIFGLSMVGGAIPGSEVWGGIPAKYIKSI